MPDFQEILDKAKELVKEEREHELVLIHAKWETDNIHAMGMKAAHESPDELDEIKEARRPALDSAISEREAHYREIVNDLANDLYKEAMAKENGNGN